MVLQIQWTDLETGWTTSFGELQFFLDKQTGEVHMLSGQGMDEEEELEEQLEIDPFRYLLIPPQGSNDYDGYQAMVDFIETVKDKDLKLSLEQAIRGRRVFRRFKDCIGADLDEEERWYDFEAAA